MLNHVVVLAAINIGRSILGFALGAYFIYCSDRAHVPSYRHARIEDWDWTAFLVVGALLLAFSCLRLLHGVLSLRDVRRARSVESTTSRRSQGGRRLGFALAIVDLLDIALFPISTPCGLYGFLIYRHPDIMDFYEGCYRSS